MVEHRGFRGWKHDGAGGRGVRCGSGIFAIFFLGGEINLQPRGLRCVEGFPDWGTHGVFVVLFQPIKGASIVEKVRSEVLDTLVGFFLLRGDEFFLGEIGVFVYGPRKGCQGSGKLACDRLFPD